MCRLPSIWKESNTKPATKGHQFQSAATIPPATFAGNHQGPVEASKVALQTISKKKIPPDHFKKISLAWNWDDFSTRFSIQVYACTGQCIEPSLCQIDVWFFYHASSQHVFTGNDSYQLANPKKTKQASKQFILPLSQVTQTVTQHQSWMKDPRCDTAKIHLTKCQVKGHTTLMQNEIWTAG